LDAAFPYDPNRISSQIGAIAGAIVGTLAPLVLVGLVLSWILCPLTRLPVFATRTTFALAAVLVITISAIGRYDASGVENESGHNQHASFHLMNRTPSQPDPHETQILINECTRYLDEANQQTLQLQSDLSPLLAGGILRASKLTTAEGISTTRSNLGRLKMLVDAHVANRIALDKTMPGRYGSLSIGAAIKRSAVESCEQRIAATRETLMKFASIWHELTDEGLNLADFMESRLGGFEVRGDNIYFSNALDVAQYNARVGRIEELWRQQQNIANESREVSDRSMRELAQLSTAD
jgi:hypothetical protein